MKDTKTGRACEAGTDAAAREAARVFPRFLRSIVLGAAFAIASATVAFADGVRSPVIALDDTTQLYEVLGHAEILDDPGGNLDIDDVTHSPAFRAGPADGQPPDGGVRWYRFRAAARPHSDAQWYLDTQRECSSADVYVPRGDGRYSLHQFGFGVPFEKHPAPGNDPMIVLPPLTGQTLYVRLQCYESTQGLGLVSERSGRFATTLGDLANTALIPLVILALGLAAVTRSRAFLLVAISGLFWGLRISLYYHAARWFPTIALPPAVQILQVSDVAAYLSAFFFYNEFLQLQTDRKRAFAALLTATAVTLIFVVGAWYLPLRLYDLSIDLYDLGAVTFFTTVTCIGVFVARAGNRSAWFIVAGAALFLASAVQFLWRAGLPPWMSSLFTCASPADIILFTIGVGDRLRQTLIAHQAVLEEKNLVQTQLVSAQEEHIADIERRNDSFARFVPAEFLRQLDRRDIVDVQLGDHIECDMAILFSDIRGFTSIAEGLTPAGTFDFLNDYLARAGPVIRAHGGFIDKYVGDAIVALFPQRPNGALDAAIGLQREVRRFNEDRAQKGRAPIAIGVGVHFGPVMLGTIGEEQRLETTVIADAVNVASRLEGMTKVVGAPIIASAALVEALDDAGSYCLRPIGEIALRGQSHATTAFEVFDGDPHDLLLHKRRTQDTFEAALAAYRNSAYARSRELFAEVAEADPHDRAAAYLRDRSATLQSALEAPEEADS